MSYCEDYKNYKGPPMTKATLNNEDVLSIVVPFYGDKLDWRESWWTAKEVFGDNCVGKEFYFEWTNEHGVSHLKGEIINLGICINPLAWLPFNLNGPVYWSEEQKDKFYGPDEPRGSRLGRYLAECGVK